VTAGLKQMSKENLFAYVHWADGYASVINIANIKVPRKEILEYIIGDKIKAPFPGYPGEHDATIIQISGMLIPLFCFSSLIVFLSCG
jgi:hypothetical protein